MKILKTVPFLALLLVFMLGINPVSVKAATASVNISSASVSIGGTASVSVSVSSDTEIGVYDLIFSYSSDILEYSGGATSGGNGIFRLYADGNIGTSDTYTISFKAKAAGTGRVYMHAYDSAAQTGVVFPLNFDGNTPPNILASSREGAVTVQAPINASTNNNLSSLVVSAITSSGSTKPVTLSPAFSPAVTTYSAAVDESVTKLSISAIPADSKATTRVEWTSLDPGANKTYIRVTAENGAVKTYTINTNVSGEGESTSETESSSNETSSEVTSSDLTVSAEGKTMTVATTLDGIILPAGYTAETYTYKEAEVPVAKNTDLGLMLFYLSDEEGTGSFYVYDEQADLFFLYQTIQTGEGIFTLMQADDTVTVPLVYNRTRITIDGQEMDGWLNDFEQDFGLVYVMNPSGEKGIYQYDFKENTIQRFNRELVDGLASAESSGNGTDETEGGIIGKFQDILGSFLGVIAFVALVLICIILIIVCIVLAVKNSRKREYEEDEDLTDIIGESEEYLEDETELNDDKVIPAPLIIDSNEPAEEMEQHVLLPDEETEVADEAMTDVDNTKIAEGVMTEEELLAFKKQCEDILSTGDSFEAKETDGFDDSNRSDLDLLADEGFEILDDDDDEVNE